ncbi:alpha/beta fold hydrolase [Diaminobutyricimonas sp. TR449]|uniref:dienelactone hydrolase family protein n=1 Tax=Diaminobutyricimonas sp. TR449 TaxID=2708076 RepID=UPI00141E4873|nr:alpha/beta fold hydrolase [Diaminobutyricimonas sp. TR449]
MALIEIAGADGPVEAWLARPVKGAVGARRTTPAVLLYMDALGLRPRIWEMADRIAAWGHTVLAPNVFYRSGTAGQTSPDADLRRPGAREAFFEEAIPRMNALTSDLSRADTAWYLQSLQELSGSRQIAVVGYCMGVRLALRAAGDHPELVKSLAGFHGGALVADAADSPHLSLHTARASLMLRHADQDRSMPPAAMAEIAAVSRRVGLQLSQEVYPNAPHGYSMSDTSMYDESAAEQHFTDLQAHLEAASSLGSE